MSAAFAQPLPDTFSSLGVPADLVAALEKMDRPAPFPIQAATLPTTLGGADVLGRGKTGSGKTLAFSIPLVARLAESRSAGSPRGLVLAPTRELATQITRTIEPLAKAKGLRVTTIFGGVSQKPQETALRSGVDIVVACPGRLDDLMKQGVASLDRIEITVLDEADHMADLGFLPVVTRILNATPKRGQRMLFSATLDNGVDKLVSRFLHQPETHSVDEAVAPVPSMTHHVFEVDPEEKTLLVRTLASGAGKRILFTRTKHQAKKLAKQLTGAGIPAVDLHGNLSQNARDRNLADFSSGRVRVLVATDVAARGVHVDDVELVVHVDPPAEHKAYLHRSGRTARAGAEGAVVTVMLPAQKADTVALLRKARISVTPQRVTSVSPAVEELVGEKAERVAPRPGGPGVGNAPGATPAGTSQGANAVRKRAAREQRGGGSSRSNQGRGAAPASGSGKSSSSGSKAAGHAAKGEGSGGASSQGARRGRRGGSARRASGGGVQRPSA